ncbi:MAG: helix-turn-helix transcriptional regulator [Lachnospiraceae bacterium]|nr:helix-turn-helix transcriptional regulator [Lachnospiraceae bacterium]
MIFADKLIRLRKKSGWSQEELAEQMNVTRQSVSKWEGAQSIPDLEKMIRLSELFGVSLDYLLKDRFEEADEDNGTGTTNLSEDAPRRRVSMEEANAFLSVKAATAKSTAIGAFLCIISPICLLLLGAISESGAYGLSENAAGGIGIIVLLLFVVAAIPIFISNGSKTGPFDYLDTEIFETEYGVSGMVMERRKNFQRVYTRNNIIGTCLCVVSVIPLFAAMIFDEENELLMVAMLAMLFFLVGVGVIFFIWGNIIWESYQKLLQEGEYSRQRKKRRPIISAVSTGYWLLVTAAYVAYSTAFQSWGDSWILWPVAGLIFPVVIVFVNLLTKREETDHS